MNKVTTFCQLPKKLKRVVESRAIAQDKTLSVYLSERIVDVLRSGMSDILIRRLERGAEKDLIPTTIVLPKEVLILAKVTAAEQGVSMADVFRYCLIAKEKVKC